MPIGIELRNDIRDMIARAFYLDKLTGPNLGGNPQMTAFEVGQRVQDYIRKALPLFEPMEQQYNGGICEEAFSLGMHNGLFGSPHDMPPSLRGQDIRFRFESPLTELIDSQKGSKLLNAKQLLAQVADVAPDAVHVLNWSSAFRDALEGNRTPAAWMVDPAEAQAAAEAQQKAQQQQALLDGMQKAATVADTLGSAGKGFADAASAGGLSAGALA